MDTTKPKTTPKDFFLWAGAMVAFYWTAIASIFLIFDYINYALPNALSYYPTNPYDSGISSEMASIIVLLPVYLLLMWLIRKDIVADPSRKEIWVRRWAIILTLFVAGATIAGDLITLLTTFLSGQELTLAFLLKVLVILIFAVKVFLYFIFDLRGYWDQFPKRRRIFSIGAVVAGVVVIVAGFFIVGTPQHARLERFDAQKVIDLQNIQSEVTSYYQAKQTLPASLSDLNNAISYGSTPVDPQGEPYTYQATGALSFKLCATFNVAGVINQTTYAQPMGITPGSEQQIPQDYWSHASGNVCFDRTIDPAFYPPLKN